MTIQVSNRKFWKLTLTLLEWTLHSKVVYKCGNSVVVAVVVTGCHYPQKCKSFFFVFEEMGFELGTLMYYGFLSTYLGMPFFKN